ncbi:MAG TPA: RagB/SusD family nutrient uptake outer membrane protein [Chitinophagaceae bacterium]|nr:RagB/SusD family nutrient uptake outer membrane protein [Chitinophagaceae bacterium]
MKKNDKREAASIDWFVDPHNEAYDEAQHDSMRYIKKFAAPPTLPNEQDVDSPVYRYAEVLLWEAEAYNEPGQTAQAYPKINKVRNRAGLADLTSGLNQAAFRKAVYHDERVESAFEDHRFQLLRTGTAIDAMTQHENKKPVKKWLLNESYDMQA